MVIAGNTARIRLGTAATHERHGIFVGNFTSLQIQGNRLQGLRTSLAQDVHSEGIRIYGVAGPRMIVRDNDMDRFDTGIAFVTKVLPGVRLWVITQNLAQNAANGVLAHRREGQQLTSIRTHIRGVSENVP